MPVAEGVADVARQLGADPAQFAVTGGEDFELCACIGDAAAVAVPGLTRIGDVQPGPGIVSFRRSGAAVPGLSGYQHLG